MEAPNLRQEDVDQDGLGDACDPCPTRQAAGLTPDDCLEGAESEPNDGPDFDRLEVPGLTAGVIGRPEDGVPDRDVYRLTVLEAPMFVRLRLDGRSGSLEGRATVRDLAGRGWRRTLDAAPSGDGERDLLLLWPGDYEVVVDDRRNLAGGELTGGVSWSYRLSTDVRPMQVATIDSLPHSDAEGLTRAGDLRSFDVGLAAGVRARFVTYADRGFIPSALDTILVALDPERGDVLAQSDDEAGGSTDSEVRILAQSAMQVRLVIDHRHTIVKPADADPDLPDPRTVVRFEATLVEPGVEVEPNERPEGALTVAPGDSLTGRFGGDSPALDVDLYRLQVAPGELIEVTVAPTDDSLADPLVELTAHPLSPADPEAPATRVENVNDDSADPPAAVAELLPGSPGPWFARVRAAPGALTEGLQEYRISVRSVAREPAALEALGRIEGVYDPPGRFVRHAFDAPAGGIIEVVPGAAAGIRPHWRVLGTDGFTRLASPTGPTRIMVPEAGRYAIALTDADGGGGPDSAYAFDLAVTPPAGPQVAEDEPNNDVDGAQELELAGEGTLAVAAGFSVEDPGDLYVIELDRGVTLTAWTAFGPGLQAPDTRLEMYRLDPDRQRIMLARDDDGAGVAGLSRIEAHAVTRRGPHYIHVLPDPSVVAPAPYTLVVEIRPCAPPAGGRRLGPGDAVINEVLTTPGDALDSNRDGVVDSLDDEFIELVSVADVRVELGGSQLADGVGRPYRFACGTVLPPLSPIVVFGGGAPVAPIGAALIRTHDDGGLTMGDVSERVVLRARDGTELDAVEWIGLLPGQSRVRSPELEGPLTPHLEAAHAAGAPDPAATSPGLRVDGNTFDGSIFVANDLCGGAAPIQANGADIPGDLTHARDLYSTPCGRSPDGPEVSYVLRLDEVSSLRATVHARGGWSPVITARRDRCADGLFAGCADPAGPAAARSATLDLDEVPAGDLHLLVSGHAAEDSGAFDLEVTTGPAVLTPSNDRCDTAEPIFGPGSYLGSLRRARNDLSMTPAQSCTGWSTEGPDVAFVVDIPPATTMDLRAVPLALPDPLLDLSVYLVTDCSAPVETCLRASDEAGPGGAEHLNLAAPAQASRRVFIIVDSAWPDAAGDFELLIDLRGP